ncbi:MAG: phosphate ABC transporter permease subunit PstC, partial [Acidobacteriota bacterium]|nr:phosphate ABC transporter permease subunit PstC [Acidobacteriota bacterium]
MASRPNQTRPDERVFRAGAGAFGLLLIVIVVAIGIELYRQSQLSIERFGWHFWTTDTWDPVLGEYGARPFIWGTFYSSILALLIAGP